MARGQHSQIGNVFTVITPTVLQQNLERKKVFDFLVSKKTMRGIFTRLKCPHFWRENILY